MTQPNRGPLIPSREARKRTVRTESRVHVAVYGFFFLVLALVLVYFFVIASPA